MQGKLEKFTLSGHACAVLAPQGRGPYGVSVLCGLEPERLPTLAQNLPDMALMAVQAEGMRDYTPWAAPPLQADRPFTGQAQAFLDFLTGQALPALALRAPVEERPCRRLLAGYSLGGLFALWAAGQCGAFGLAASLSGSLWYDGWLEYLQDTPLRAGRIYLSLGRAEEHGGPARMRAVGEATRSSYAFLSDQLGPGRVTLQWNRGGHFTGIPMRWERALCWAAPYLAGQNPGDMRPGSGPD